jgi:hypothetical protein
MSNHNIVTIFCCGTNFDRENLTSAVPYTYTQVQGRKFILDGPGSMLGNVLNAENVLKAVEDKKSYSKYNPLKYFHTRNKAKALASDNFTQGKKYRLKTNTASISGDGTADNIIVALQWLILEFYNIPFTTINLVGWSRGAVTCIMLSHSIKEAFAARSPNIKVNIFAFDPVPGGLNDFGTKGKCFDSTGRIGSFNTLPSIVNEYNAVLMENEGKPGFACISPAEFSTAQYLEVPLPGSHSDSVKFDKAGNHSGKIAIHLCHDFLRRNGTVLAEYKTLSPGSIVESYSALRLNVLMKGSKTRKAGWFRRNIIKNRMRDDVYFINGHHHDVLRDRFSNVFIQLLLPDGTRDYDFPNCKASLQQLPQTAKLLKHFYS